MMVAVFLLLGPFLLFVSTEAFTPTIEATRRPSLVRLHTSSAIIPDQDPFHHDQLLWGMTRYFGDDMVDSDTKRFYYTCRPHDGECKHVHFPIRDLAAAWDAQKAFEFTNNIMQCQDDIDKADVLRIQQQLEDAIKCTLSFYSSSLKPIDLGMKIHLHEDVLMEAPNIGHSALLLLGLCNNLRLSNCGEHEEDTLEMVDGLTQGILSMQMPNGAFAIEFGKEDDNYINGIEFFPGEAMLSLMTVHELSIQTCLLEESTRNAILPAMARAFQFYSNYYHTQDVDINYNIWQVLAFAKYHDALHDNRTERENVTGYILEMCQEICQSRSWKYQLARGQSFYINLETVEIAVGLDSLAEGIRIAQEEKQDDLAKMFKMHATNALYFLKWATDQVPDSCAVGRGGLGYGGVQVFEQRLDVTGHAISALVKLRDLSVLLPA